LKVIGYQDVHSALDRGEQKPVSRAGSSTRLDELEQRVERGWVVTIVRRDL
jgi:hypothetical protein